MIIGVINNVPITQIETKIEVRKKTIESFLNQLNTIEFKHN